MATLKLKEETPTRLVYGTDWGQRLSNLVSLIILLGVGYSLLSSFSDGSFGDTPIFGVILLVFVLFGLNWIYSVLANTQVVIDTSSRTATRNVSFLGIPIRSSQLPLDRVRRVQLNLGSQTTRRQRVGGGWQVSLEPVEGSPFVVNSDGSRGEMTAVAQKVSSLIGKPFDPSPSSQSAGTPVPNLGPIQDFGGSSTSYAPPVASPFPLGRAPAPSTLTKEISDDTGKSNDDSSLLTATQNVDTSQSTDYQTSQPSGPSPAMPSYAPMGTGLDSGMPPLESSPSTPSMSPFDTMSQPPLSPTPAPITSIPDVDEAAENQDAKKPPRRRSMEELQKAISEDSNDADAYYQLARAYQTRGVFDKALESYQNATRLDPLNAGAQNDLGVLLMMRGNFKDAESLMRRAAATDPFSATPHYNLGLLLLRVGRRPEAQQEFNRAVMNGAGDKEAEIYSAAANGRPGSPLLTPGQ